MTGLPQQQRICGSQQYQFGGTISPAPAQGTICNQALSVSACYNNCFAQ